MRYSLRNQCGKILYWDHVIVGLYWIVNAFSAIRVAPVTGVHSADLLYLSTNPTIRIHDIWGKGSRSVGREMVGGGYSKSTPSTERFPSSTRPWPKESTCRLLREWLILVQFACLATLTPGVVLIKSNVGSLGGSFWSNISRLLYFQEITFWSNLISWTMSIRSME